MCSSTWPHPNPFSTERSMHKAKICCIFHVAVLCCSVIKREQTRFVYQPSSEGTFFYQETSHVPFSSLLKQKVRSSLDIDEAAQMYIGESPAAPFRSKLCHGKKCFIFEYENKVFFHQAKSSAKTRCHSSVKLATSFHDV